MNYQAIRASLENGLLTAYNSLAPSVPVYFDNVFNYDSDSSDEFVHINIQFGLTTESTLTTQLDMVRGIIVIRTYTPKGSGPARNQTLVDTAFTTLQTINNTTKTTSGVYMRLGSIDGPTFSPNAVGTSQVRQEELPYFVSRIETSFQAQVIS